MKRSFHAGKATTVGILIGLAGALALNAYAARNGSGVYNLPAGNPVATGTPISSTWANNTLADIRDALSQSVSRDGQTSMTGNFNLGNNRITNLADPAAATDAATRQYATNASNLASGTVADARLSANVPRLDTDNTFTAPNNRITNTHASWSFFKDSTPSVAGAVGVNITAADGAADAMTLARYDVVGGWKSFIDFSGSQTTLRNANVVINAPASGSTLSINALNNQDAVALASSTGNVRIGMSAGGHQAYIGIDAFTADHLGIGTNGATPVAFVSNGTVRGILGAAGGWTLDSLAVNGSATVGGKSVAVTDGTGASGTWGISITGNAATATSATTASSATKAGIPRRTSGLSNGELLSTSSGITLNTSDCSAGYAFSILNASASAITITQGSGMTLYNSNDASTGNVSLQARGMATIYCDSSSAAYVGGNVT